MFITSLDDIISERIWTLNTVDREIFAVFKFSSVPLSDEILNREYFSTSHNKSVEKLTRP